MQLQNKRFPKFYWTICVWVKWPPVPASSLAWAPSGLAPTVRVRRPAYPPLWAKYKTPSPLAFFLLPPFLHTLAAASLQHGSAPLPWPSIADCQVSTVHEVHRPSSRHGSLASQPAHFHPVSRVSGRSGPSHPLSRSIAASLQLISNRGCSILGRAEDFGWLSSPSRPLSLRLLCQSSFDTSLACLHFSNGIGQERRPAATVIGTKLPLGRRTAGTTSWAASGKMPRQFARVFFASVWAPRQGLQTEREAYGRCQVS